MFILKNITTLIPDTFYLFVIVSFFTIFVAGTLQTRIEKKNYF